MKRVMPKKWVLLSLIILVVASVLVPVSVWAQATWGTAQMIDTGSEFDATSPAKAQDGNNVVSVWEEDGYIYSSYSTDGGSTWGTDTIIDAPGGLSAYEPQIAISGSNVVATCYQFDGTTYRIYSNYSADGGKTWKGAKLIEANVGQYGSSPLMTMDGLNVVVVWLQFDGTSNRIWSNSSQDGGKTWGVAQKIENNIGHDGYDPQVVIFGNYVVAVWDQGDGTAERIYENSSQDGGKTWSGAHLLENNTGQNGYSPHLSMFGTNAVVDWSQFNGTNYLVYGNTSQDSGQTWKGVYRLSILGSDALNASIGIVGPDAIALWSQSKGTARQVYSSSSEDGGATWSGATDIDNNPGYSVALPYLAKQSPKTTSVSKWNAIWAQSTSTKDRIFSNYGSFPAHVG